jgi:hypothetical protein
MGGFVKAFGLSRHSSSSSNVAVCIVCRVDTIEL